MTTTTLPAARTKPAGTVQDKGLRTGTLGLIASVVLGIASTAPAYSLAASLGWVVDAGAGVKAPGIMLLSFVPMYFIAVAYRELNEADPDCGTTFTWAARAFGPVSGWMGGWGIIVADVICMANLAQVAGSYSFSLADQLGLHNHLATNLWASTTAGLLWIIVMTWLCYLGIEVAARIQYVLLGLEVVTLTVFGVTALARVWSGHGVATSLRPQWSWLLPTGLDAGTIATAVLAAVFIYWGWDSAVSTNEEAQDPTVTPGRAAVLSTVLLLFTYVLVSYASVAFAGVGTEGIGLGNLANADDSFSAIGPVLFGSSPWGRVGQVLLAVSILTSAAACTQTTILPTARTSLSMGVFKALPQRFAEIHPRYLTPTWSTLGFGAVSCLFYLAMTAISPRMLTAAISCVGLQIAFYYGLTGFAATWFHRDSLTTSLRHLVVRGIIPTLGGLVLFAALGYATWSYAKPDYLTDADGSNITLFGLGAVAVVGIGSLLAGVPLMLLWRAVEPRYFRGETLPRSTASDLVLVDQPLAPASTFEPFPDSWEATVIAPDLSNLPEGQAAVDMATGEVFQHPGEGPRSDA